MSWIKEEDMKAIRQNADIVDILSNYLTLDKKGKDYRAVCPFHDDHDPSLSVSVDKQIFKCFVCGTGGNVFTFVQKIEQITFPESVIKVAELIHYPLVMPTASFTPKQNVNQPLYDILQSYIQFIQYELKSQDGLKCSRYLHSRHLTPEIIERFQIGYAPEANRSYKFLKAKNYSNQQLVDTGLIYDVNSTTTTFFDRFMIPIHDESGNPVGFTARRLSEDKSISKYINTGQTPIFEKGNLIFNYHRAKESARKEKRCFLVEGAMDVLAYEKAGIHEAVACLGTACTSNQIRLLKKLQVPIYVGYDGDRAGRDATYKFCKLAIHEGVPFQILKNNTEMDPDELLEKYGKEEFISRLSNTVPYVEFLLEYLTKIYDLNNYEDKKKYAQEIFDVVNKTCDEFEIPMYITRIKSITGFDFSSMVQTPQRSKTPQKIVKSIQPLMPGRLQAEKNVLSMILVNKSAANRFKNEIGFFQDSVCDQLSLYLYDEYRERNTIDTDALLAKIEEEPVRNLLIEFLCDDTRSTSFNEEYFNDSIIKIKECTIQEQINQINRNVEQMTNPLEKAKLAIKKNELIAQKIALRQNTQ